LAGVVEGVMASFDKLVDFLLEKVALSGEEGMFGYRSKVP